MDITDMTALELGRAIRGRKISVREAAEASLQRIKGTEERIRAFLEIREDYVWEQVEEVERGIREGKYTSALAGVPISIKDNICTADLKTTCASRMLENFTPSYNAEAVNRLLKAGMVIIGKTNMDEFAMGSTTETSAFGITRNPWDEERAPGGSSGGSCAAVAAGDVPAALGSDTGGSIRQPASHCGVTGLKPTYGTVSRNGLIAYASSLDQIGTIGRDTADCAAVLEIIAGWDAMDSTSVKREELRFTEVLQDDCKGLRIGLPEEYLSGGLEEDVKNAWEHAACQMERQGAQVEYFSLGMTDFVIPSYYVIASAEASSNLSRYDGIKYGFRAADYDGLHDLYKKTRTEGFGDEVKRRILLGSFVLSSGYYEAYYLQALKVRALIKEAFDKAFTKYDVILAPASPSTAPRLGMSLSDPLKMYLSDVYTAGVNLAGLPAICVPCAADRNGLPIGLQFIGNGFEEKKIIRAAVFYEKIRGTFPAAWKVKA